MLKTFLRGIYSKILQEIFYLREKEYLTNGWREEVESFLKSLEQDYETVTGQIKDINPAMAAYDNDRDGLHLETLYLVASIHYLQKDAMGLNNILEIGTGLGENTAILSKIAPKAYIYTYDLPEDDPAFEAGNQVRDTAWRQKKDMAFDQNVAADNIKLRLRNSLFLLDEELPEFFDLIWMDGAHCYPAVSWDFFYSYSRLREGGILLIDDWVNVEKMKNPITGRISDATLNDVADLVEYIQPRIKSLVKFLPRQPLGKKSIVMIMKED